MSFPIATLASLTFACLAPAPAVGQSPPPAAAPASADYGGPAFGSARDPDDGLRVDLSTYAWLMGVEGDVGVGGQTADVSADFGDILDASDSVFAFSGRLEVGKGRWGVFADGMYANLGADDQSGPLGLADVDVTFEETLLDFGVMFRVAEGPAGALIGEGNARNATLDLYAGARYTDLSLELAPANLAASSGDQQWLDPIVGARGSLPFAGHGRLQLSGDVGGFGVESDFTWSLTGTVGYDFSLFNRPASVFGGYRAIGQDFVDGSGPNQFVWDVIQHGPVIGFSISL